MYNHERRPHLLKMLSRRGFIAVTELTAVQYLTAPGAARHRMPFAAGIGQQQMPLRAARQRAIARAAAAMRANGDTITINGSTATLPMAESLATKQLTV